MLIVVTRLRVGVTGVEPAVAPVMGGLGTGTGVPCTNELPPVNADIMEARLDNAISDDERLGGVELPVALKDGVREG